MSNLFLKIKNFKQHDNGAVLVLFALAALPVIIFSGMAIDASRAYYAQSVIASAVDSAAIAAGRQADTTKAKAEAEMVFKANIPANFIGDVSSGIKVQDNGKQVTVTGSAIVQTTFMNLIGENSVTVNSTSMVDREVAGLELVLSMDTTGSMASNNKLELMKQAANSLLNVIYGTDTTKKGVYVGLVPYSSTVNIGTYGLQPTRWTNWLTSTAKTKTTPPSTNNPAFFYTTKGKKTTITEAWTGCVHNRLDDSMYTNNDGEGDDTIPSASDKTRWGVFDNTVSTGCPAPMISLQSKITDVRSSIASMTASGWTTVNVGLAWGWRMLSPKWRGLWNDSSDPATLPQDYKKTTKAIVLLTDGINEIGGSPIGSGSDYSGYGYVNDGTLGSKNYYTIQNTLNTRLTDLCTRVKSQGIIIFTITLEQNDPTIQSLLRNCASNPSYYFNSPSAKELDAIFKTIGNTLQSLRYRWPGKP